MASYDITSDNELETAVRAETLYDDVDDELPSSDLGQIVDNTKMLVHAKTGSDQWYNDRGLGLVLFGLVCARAKAAVENLPIQRLSLDPVSIEARSSSGDSIQLTQYEQYVSEGMSSSTVTTRSTPPLSVSNSWMTSDPTPHS